MSAVTNPDFESLLEYLGRTRGFDFTAYKRPSLQRRINQRLQSVKIASVADYIDYLEVHPEEFAQLFNTILINVTGFFRDPEVWAFVRDQVVPRIVAAKRSTDPIRFWSAGCASGEEACTLAMLMAEVVGFEQFRQRVKIYATDVDDEALNQARQSSYTQKQVEDVPPELLERYFERVNGRFTFNKELRRTIIFGRHDLILDAPISKVDLLVCRNTLMYFNAEAQSRILSRFGFALNDGGFLFLGKAETLLSRSDLFVPVDIKRRVFMRASKGERRERHANGQEAGGINGQGTRWLDLNDLALERDPVAQLVVDANGTLVMVNESARLLFGLSAFDVDRPLRDLELSYRPVELRSLIEQSLSDQRTLNIKEAEFPSGAGALRYFDVSVLPLVDSIGRVLGVKVLFTDVTRHRRLQEDLQQSHAELETANEELQSANEELETTNEELQSTIEELETTNEELQSTNEELETMNEEMQSTNEQLTVSNEQLRQRGEEVDRLNGFLESILSSLSDGVIVIDHDLLVSIWNQRAEDLWGMHASEVRDRHLFNLDIGLPVEQLRQPIRASMADGGAPQELTLQATNRRGKPIRLKVAISPLSTNGERKGAILLMSELHDAQP